MNAPVDVLEVLQRQIDIALSYGNDERAEALQDVHAAVAELIEAAREGSATLGHIYHTTPLHPELDQYAHDGYQRLDAALARVGGGK